MNDAISRSNAISRSAALSMMNEYIDMAQDDEMHHAMCVVAEGLAELPALDVAPVKHGHWIHCKGKSNLWYCSECGDKMLYNPTRRTYNIVKLTMAEKNKFCRNCGARMDGEADG